MSVSWAWAIDPVALALVGGAIARFMYKRDQRWNQFHRDWNGEAARPGVPARPGVMERLSMTENVLSVVVTDIADIKQKVNKGTT